MKNQDLHESFHKKKKKIYMKVSISLHGKKNLFYGISFKVAIFRPFTIVKKVT